MNNDLISRSALLKDLKDMKVEGEVFTTAVNFAIEVIDNAPAVEETVMVDKSNFSKEQYNADLQSAYDCGYESGKNERPKGEWVRKKDVIHSIAKQYSEHNEVVPIWLSIGDMKGGAE